MQFFSGKVEQNSHVHVHPHAHHCAQLSTAVDVHRFLLQTPLTSHDRTRVTYGLANLEHLHSSNCVNVPSFSPTDLVEVDMDPRRPLLAFLASALPENHSESSSLDSRLEEHVSDIIMTPETHLLGDHASLGMSMSNVPGAVSDVKARIVWMQVPTEHGVKLELVHRVCVLPLSNSLVSCVTSSRWKWNTTGMKPLSPRRYPTALSASSIGQVILPCPCPSLRVSVGLFVVRNHEFLIVDASLQHHTDRV